MTSEQECRFSMYREVMEHLNNNLTIVNTIPNMNVFVPAMNDVIQQIILNVEEQSHDITGVAANKKALRTDIETKGLDIALKVVAYATISGNLILLNEARMYNKSELTRCADNILKIHCQCIYDMANNIVVELDEYGVNAAILADFETVINDYYDTIALPGIKIADRKVITEMIKLLFVNGNTILKKTDAMIEVVRVSHPEFYSEYKNLRKITNTGKRKMAVKGTALNQKDKPIRGAVFEFKSRDNNLTKSVIKHTYIKGSFFIRSLNSGIYDVTITKVGYDTQTVEVIVDGIEMQRLVVKLVK